MTLPKKLIRKKKKVVESLLIKGRLAEAKKETDQLCNLDPGDVEIWQRVGEVAAGLNLYTEARFAYQRALELNPNIPELYCSLGYVQESLGDYSSALQSYHSFLVMAPGNGEGHLSRALLLKKCGYVNDAVAGFRKAVSLGQDGFDLCVEFGALLQRLGSYGEAYAYLQRALEIEPESAKGFVALGTYHRDQREYSKALSFYEQAFMLEPNEGIHQFYIASVYEMQGEKEHALACYQKALQHDPQLLDARMRHSTCALSLGRLAEGFAGYEYRLQYSVWQQRNQMDTQIPLWSGEPLEGKRVLVIAEQGYGDAIQFCRYLQRLSAQCNASLFCRPEISSLIGSMAGGCNVIVSKDAIPVHEFDFCIYMMSLPYLFNTELETIPGEVPYLFPATEDMEKWKQKLGGEDFKVGLAWSGSAEHARNAFRNISLNELAPLGDVPNVRFFSLQKGAGAEQIGDTPDGFQVVDLDQDLRSFSDTAAAISALDLVITVDTAVAHLAGALAKPVWTLLYFPAEWRWLEGRDDSPWYPTMHLYRQTGEWKGVVQRLVGDLEAVVRSR